MNKENYFKMFKAKAKFGIWIYGLIDIQVSKSNSVYSTITEFKFNTTEFQFVDFLTICRNTFIQDINDNDIFSNDIIKLPNGKIRTIFEIPGGFGFECLDQDIGQFGKTYVPYESCGDEQNRSYLSNCKVIGNIFDNYNLIEQFNERVRNERT